MNDTARLIGGRYRIDRELGRSPLGCSLLVTDVRNGRPCVMRRLSLALAPQATVRRFEAQAAILAKLDFAGLPRFIDGFTTGEGEARERVVVTTYHPGESLERLVAKGRLLTEARALALLRNLVPVLAYLHGFEPPLVHRAIGMAGIIIGPDGRPCLTDLDYALAAVEESSGELTPPGPDEIAAAAPEVFMDGAVPASDLYALGLALLRGMTQQDPAVFLREVSRTRLRDALGISEHFASVLARLLEPSPERRYADVKALDADLVKLAGVRVLAPIQPEGVAAAPTQAQPERGLADRQNHRRGRSLLVAGGVVLTLAVLAAVAVRMRTAPAPDVSLVMTDLQRGQPAAPALPAAEHVAPAPAPAPETAPATDTSPSPGAGVEAASVEAAPPAIPAVPAALEPQTPAPAGSLPIVVDGRLLLGGKPYLDTTAPAPQFWFRNETTKSATKPQVEFAADRFTVRGLPPGRYGISVRIDADRSNPNIFPGDLNGWSEFLLEPGRSVALAVPLRRVIHLLQPVDNGVVIRGWDVPCGGGDALSAPVVFSWESLGAGASYEVSVDRLLCSRGYASAGRVFSRSTLERQVEIPLPPSREGECYSFRLTASSGGGAAGVLATHGKTGLGWDYRFTVAR